MDAHLCRHVLVRGSARVGGELGDETTNVQLLSSVKIRQCFTL